MHATTRTSSSASVTRCLAPVTMLRSISVLTRLATRLAASSFPPNSAVRVEGPFDTTAGRPPA